MTAHHVYPHPIVRRLLAVAFTAALAFTGSSCRKKGDLAPAGDPDALTIKAQQDVIINSPYVGEALSGTYRLSSLRWYSKANQPSDYTEYFPSLDEPESNPGPSSGYISKYHLLVRPTAKKDSVRLLLDGDGFGSSFSMYDLGTYNVALFRKGTYSPPPVDYRTDYWQLGLPFTSQEHQLSVSRAAHVDYTLTVFSVSLVRVIDKTHPRYGQIIIPDRSYGDYTYDNSMVLLARTGFARKSVGVLLDRK